MIRRLLFALGSAAALASPAAAQDDFYAGKTISLYIGFGPGGNYDSYARLLARHMGGHIPGAPEIVPMNMEGAGSMLLANWLYNVAPADGTAIATISRAVPFYPLLFADGAARFEATEFTWLGSANDEVSTCVAWAGSGIASVEDLMADGMIMGGDGPTADGEQFARLMNGVLGTRIEVVTGYGGSGDMNLAMEQGEIEGRCGWSWSSVVSSHADWIEDGTINVLVQMGREKHPDLPDTPSLTELVDDPDDQALVDIVLARQPLGRPYLAPPGVPEDRARILRDAFAATMRDEDFLAEARQAGLDIAPLSGEEVRAVVDRVYSNSSDAVIARLRAMLTP